jgi:hypothetical protein
MAGSNLLSADPLRLSNSWVAPPLGMRRGALRHKGRFVSDRTIASPNALEMSARSAWRFPIPPGARRLRVAPQRRCLYLRQSSNSAPPPPGQRPQWLRRVSDMGRLRTEWRSVTPDRVGTGGGWLDLPSMVLGWFGGIGAECGPRRGMDYGVRIGHKIMFARIASHRTVPDARWHSARICASSDPAGPDRGKSSAIETHVR